MAEQFSKDLVVRIRAKNGKDKITAEQVERGLESLSFGSVGKFIVQQIGERVPEVSISETVPGGIIMAEQFSKDLVVRIRAKNGKDQITVEDLQDLLDTMINHFVVQEVEGNSLEVEALATAAREIIKKHIVEPLSDIPMKMIHDINEEWQTHKEPIEQLLQGKFATCPQCGAQALSAPLSNDVKFICPHCETTLRWKFHVDKNHADGGRYTLVK